MDEFVFASHTSVISKALLFKELNSQKGIPIPSGGTTQQGKGKGTDEPLDTKRILQEKILNKKKLTECVLEEEFDNGLPEGENPLKRVKIQALDFDWLFEGENAKSLLTLLSTEANNACLTKKSIKTFVDLMWSYY